MGLQDMTVLPILFGTLFANKGHIAQWPTQLLHDNDTALVNRVRKNMVQPHKTTFYFFVHDTHRLVPRSGFFSIPRLSGI